MSLSNAPLRPREKLLKHGANALCDAELLAIFLRTGVAGCNAVELAQTLLFSHQGLQGVFDASLKELCNCKGVGETKFVQLQAVLELSKRYLEEQISRDSVLDSPNAVRKFVRLQLKSQQRELFFVLLLDSQNRMVHHEVLFSGTINAAAVYPREVVKLVLKYNAASIILAHNHPSGVAEPSQADKLITTKLQQALNLVDVAVLDHLLIAGAECMSFAERGLL